MIKLLYILVMTVTSVAPLDKKKLNGHSQASEETSHQEAHPL